MLFAVLDGFDQACVLQAHTRQATLSPPEDNQQTSSCPGLLSQQMPIFYQAGNEVSMAAAKLHLYHA